ncbi:MAG: pyridoxamine 5'-phosphate oxidase family protein [Siculibacillus sp.]
MAQPFPGLDRSHREFIERQKIFFAASAAPQGRVNVSPRGTEHFRIMSPNAVMWLDLTGSSNETAAHLLVDGRMTVMFCAFDGAPRILRLYGIGRVIGRGSGDWDTLATLEFDGRIPHGARQMIWLDADLVQTSCGYGVPLFDFVAPRDNLDRWATAKSDAELEAYRREKNAVSMDGLPTGLFPD